MRKLSGLPSCVTAGGESGTSRRPGAPYGAENEMPGWISWHRQVKQA